MPAYTIPTVFTAVDLYSRKVVGMTGVTNMLANSVGKATMSLVTYGAAALAVGGILASGKGIMEYQTEIQNLSAVTGAAGAQLDTFKDKITDVAKETQKSTVEVAKAFTNVDNNMPQLHKDAEALAEVTKQSIILAKAGRMELGPSAESLTMSMNQFGHGAQMAARDVDALASGAVAGSSRIAETTEALLKFGSMAAQTANVTYAESVALVELASKFEKGAEAGTRLRYIMSAMTTLKFNDTLSSEMASFGVDVEKVSNTLIPFGDRLKEISKIKGHAGAIFDLFGQRNQNMAAGLFSVVDKYDDVLKVTSRVGAAEEMAAKNTDTLQASVEQLGAAWTTYITTSKSASASVWVLQGTITNITKHMDGLLTVVEIGVGLWGTYKVVTMSVTAATWALNFATGVGIARQAEMGVVMLDNTAAVTGYNIALKAASLNYVALGVGAVAVAAGIGIIAMEMDKAARIEKYLNGQLEFTKDGLEKLKKPSDEASLALKSYTDDYTKWYKSIEREKAKDYDRKVHPLEYIISDMFDNSALNETPQQRVGNAPEKSSYPHLNPAQADIAIHAISPSVPDSPTSFNNNNNIQLNVQVDKEGGVAVVGNNNGSSIPVKIVNSRLNK
jgi:TP901 family phage tail tape measure protein